MGRAADLAPDVREAHDKLRDTANKLEDFCSDSIEGIGSKPGSNRH